MFLPPLMPVWTYTKEDDSDTYPPKTAQPR